LSLRRFKIPFICEGGALEVNGSGTLLTTESVLLNANRNPDTSKAEMEAGLLSGVVFAAAAVYIGILKARYEKK